jgi:hypothetical protein
MYPYRRYAVSRASREPLLRFMCSALEACGCDVVNASDPSLAPFQISAVTPWGERFGVVAYAFLANSKMTRNRPEDEWRYQIKYGSDDKGYHDLWQDPYWLYTTLLVGIDLNSGVFVGADPVLNSPTRFFISKEFKQHNVDDILRHGWSTWERDFRSPRESRETVEVLVGGRAERFLDYVRFEREVRGEEQGNRMLVAESVARGEFNPVTSIVSQPGHELVGSNRFHVLEREFELSRGEVLDLIDRAPRLKTAVRGWVAERHLERVLTRVSGVDEVSCLEEDGQPDFRIVYRGRVPVTIECKNVLRGSTFNGYPLVDFQKTRASKEDPCSRYYRASDFQLVAACLHPKTMAWEFKLQPTAKIPPHKKCSGRLHHRLPVDESWHGDVEEALEYVTHQ